MSTLQHEIENSDPSPTWPECPACAEPHASSDHLRWNHQVRGETPMQHLDRSYTELLQELRVAQTGVQIVLAFLLWLAFSPGFRDLASAERGLYVSGLFLGLSAAALLMAPACCHRLVHGRRLKRQLVTMANRCAVAGLSMLLAAVGCAVLLVLEPVVGFRAGSAATTLTLLWFGYLWYGVPVLMRRRHQHPARPLAVIPAPVAEQAA